MHDADRSEQLAARNPRIPFSAAQSQSQQQSPRKWPQRNSRCVVGDSENVPTGLPVSPPRSPVRGGWGANATWYLSTSNSFMTSRRGTRESQPAWLAGLASLASFDHAVCRRRADTKFRSDPTHAPTLRMQPLSVFRARLMSRVKTRLTTEFSGDRMPISPPPTELESHG